MAEQFDVRSRLAEGEPAVENLQQYVWACHQIGYRHPDLTVHTGQLRDWYGSEDGMDLAALHADWQALEDSARACQDALTIQDRQLSVFPAAWQGAGAEASREFLRRHREASEAVVAAMSTAREALGGLRESLWLVVDAKVDAVVEIESRTQANRADWLAAAATLRTGAGDRAAAAELIDQAVKPFVDNSIGSCWLAAMRTAMSSTADAYERATAELIAERQPVFDVPGDLGPTRSRPYAGIGERVAFEQLPVTGFTGITAPVEASPSASHSAPVSVPATYVPRAASGPVAAPLESTMEQPVSPAPPLSEVGSGFSGLGSGMSGIGQSFADALTGLLGGVDGPIPALSDLDVPEFDDPVDLTEDAEDDEIEAEETEIDETETDETEIDETETDDEEVLAGDSVEDPGLAGELEPGTPDGTSEVSADSAPVPAPAPPAAEPMPSAAEPMQSEGLPNTDPLAAQQTPCAIAADELPQVGDPPG